jgi:8-oxo-dGTP pyrophosphatase MutT (NUDIX family)
MRGREQAAAVCYRVGKRGVEFLLVRTRGGRWTFPKGGIEPGLTYAQSAALEAFEEAGVHGRIEALAFARYMRRAPSKSAAKFVLVHAYLCEVSRLGKPQESKRDRTWFLSEKAKRRLEEGRASECGGELAAIVDRAVARVRRLRSGEAGEVRGNAQKDGLQRVCLEAPSWMGLQGKAAAAALAGYIRRHVRTSTEIEAAADEHPEKFLPDIGQQLGQKLSRPILRLGSGSKPPDNISAKITAIDAGVEERSVRRAIRRRPNCEL